MNKVVHFEISAQDMDRAQKFYQEAFGWEIAPWESKYFMVTTGPTEQGKGPKEPGFINGGIAERTSDFTMPVLVMAVDNADAAIAQVEAAGGKRASETIKIAEMGLYARATDTEGNTIGVWQELKRQSM